MNLNFKGKINRINFFPNFRNVKRELEPFTLTQLSFVLFMLSLFLVLPIASIILKAFIHRGHISLHNFYVLLKDPEAIIIPPEGKLFTIEVTYKFVGGRPVPAEKVLYMGVHGPNFGYIINSLIVAAFVTLFTSILGLVTALIMARYEFPGKNIFRVLILFPMLATPFVNAYVIGKVFGPGGLVNYIFHDVLKIMPFKIEIGGLPAIILIQTLSFYPIVYLNVLASLINIDPTMEEMAENLGAKGFTLFRTITLPLALPGLAAGASIVFIFSMEDLGAPIGLSGAFGSGIHEKVISFVIYDSFRKEAIGGLENVHPRTYALALLLLLLAGVIFLLIKKYVSLKTYAMLSKGGRWKPRVRKLGWKGLAAVYFFLIPLIIISSFMQIGVIVLAITDWAIRVGVPLPSKLTGHFMASLIKDPAVLRSIVNSLTYAGLATILIILIGTSAAYIVARTRLPGLDLLDTLVTIPIAIPGIIVAVGYLIFFASYFAGTPLDPFRNPGLLLIFTYTVRRMPFTVRSVFAGLQQTHVSLEEASYSLGATRSTTFFKIVLPLISANIIGGGILSFVYAMSEVSTSITLACLNPSQGPITFKMSQAMYATAAVGAVSIAAALGVLLMISQIIAISISNYILKQRVAFLGI